MEYCYVIVVAVCLQLVVGSLDECSEENVVSNLPSCLGALATAATDPTSFWFGTDYSSSCPDGELGGIQCYNPYGQTGSNLASLVLGDNTLSSSQLKTFLEVMYTSDPGSYEGCDHTVNSSQTTWTRADPFNYVIANPWNLRHMPDVTWANETGSQYTLAILFDGRVHGMLINIEDGDINAAMKIKNYSGPLNFLARFDPVVFALYEQTDANMSVSNAWLDKIFQDAPFNMAGFAAQYKLNGAIGLNWLQVTHDAFAIQKQREAGLADNCASLVQQVMPDQNRPFLPNSTSLSVFIHTEFLSSDISFKLCCEHYEYTGQVSILDAIGSKSLDPVYSRSDAQRTISLSMRKLNPKPDTDFEGKNYTILMVDPDVSSPTFGNKELPLVHWLATNALDGQVSSANQLLPYKGPMPPDQLMHTYYLMLFEQPSLLTINNTDSWSSQDPSCTNQGRCLFNISAFSSDLDLTLVGVSWMQGYNSPYVNYSYIEMKSKSEDDLCKGVAGYGKPCPTSSAVDTRPFTGLAMLLSATTLFCRFYSWIPISYPLYS